MSTENGAERTVNIGSKTYKGKVVGFDPKTGDLHIKLEDNKDLLVRRNRIKILDSDKVGPYLTKEGYRLF